MLRFMVLHHESFLIRKSADIMLICSSPQLIAACHVLHRLLMPRHSPYALIRLNFFCIVFLYFGSQISFWIVWVSSELFSSGFKYWLYLRCEKTSFSRLLHFVFLSSTFRWNCIFPNNFGKTSIISYFCPLLFVFLLKSFFYSVVKDLIIG